MAQSRAKLDVVGYNVTRFLKSKEARRFKDSDGDGHSDFDERVPHPAERLRSRVRQHHARRLGL